MIAGQCATLCLAGKNLLALLHARLGSNEERIRRCHDERVLQLSTSGRMFADIAAAILAAFDDGASVASISVEIFRHRFPRHIPGGDVEPVYGHSHDYAQDAWFLLFGEFFHGCIVD